MKNSYRKIKNFLENASTTAGLMSIKKEIYQPQWKERDEFLFHNE